MSNPIIIAALRMVQEQGLPPHPSVDAPRTVVRWGQSFLIGWDVIWGPMWSLNHRMALTFETLRDAGRAQETARAIMQPVAWRVPDFGLSFLDLVVADIDANGRLA